MKIEIEVTPELVAATKLRQQLLMSAGNVHDLQAAQAWEKDFYEVQSILASVIAYAIMMEIDP